MNSAIIPKSDQLNYDDFIGKKSIVIKVNKVHIGTGEQKVSIFYDGDNGKPWKPCKSMCRVLVYCWGNDSKQYVGRSIELYGDSKVKWAGMEVGGIRIASLSNILEKQTIQLTSAKGKRNIFVVDVLEIDKEKEIENKLRECKTLDELRVAFNNAKGYQTEKITAIKDEMKAILEAK
jgi:hypothetical protein